MTQLEAIAAATAHRACCGTEHDPLKGKLHGYCVVCGVPWPCDTAKAFMVDPPPVQPLLPRNGGYCAACGKTMHTQTRILIAHSPDADHIVCMWCGADLTIAPPAQPDEDRREKSESQAGIDPFQVGAERRAVDRIL
jgi:hypothetical protein